MQAAVDCSGLVALSLSLDPIRRSTVRVIIKDFSLEPYVLASSLNRAARFNRFTEERIVRGRRVLYIPWKAMRRFGVSSSASSC